MSRRPCSASAAKLDHPLADVRARLEAEAAKLGINVSMTVTSIEVTARGFRLCRYDHGRHVRIAGLPTVSANELIRDRLGRIPSPIPAIASRQAYFTLLNRAKSVNYDSQGHPVGVLMFGDHLYLYEDIGVGCVRPIVIEEVNPEEAGKYGQVA